MTSIISTGTFDMTRWFRTFEISSDGILAQSATQWRWNMIDGNSNLPPIGVTLTGAGLTTGTLEGVVSELRVILDRFAPGTDPELVISGVALALSDLIDSAVTPSLDLFTALDGALDGNDTMVLGDGSVAFGDRLDVSGGSHAFGTDRMVLTGDDGTIWGDARIVEDGAGATGGDDKLFATGMMSQGLRLLGDAQTLTDATLTGGADRAFVRAELNPETGFVTSLVVGDAQEVIGSSRLVGGDDVLVGGLDLQDRIFGDAELVDRGVPEVIGGDDLIRGRTGNDFLYGDVDILAAGTLFAGNDTLNGGSGDDVMFGDVARVTGGGRIVEAGDDILHGGPGRDAMLGQGGDDLLRGGTGTDTLAGENGNDTLSGGSGADSLFGGPGGDVMYGGLGADDFIWQSAEDIGPRGYRDSIQDFNNGADKIYLDGVARDSETGELIWVGEDYTGKIGTIGIVADGARWQLCANLDADATDELVIFVRSTSVLESNDLILA